MRLTSRIRLFLTPVRESFFVLLICHILSSINFIGVNKSSPVVSSASRYATLLLSLFLVVEGGIEWLNHFNLSSSQIVLTSYGVVSVWIYRAVIILLSLLLYFLFAHCIDRAWKTISSRIHLLIRLYSRYLGRIVSYVLIELRHLFNISHSWWRSISSITISSFEIS